jgi:AcrR family transcriptional regulator
VTTLGIVTPSVTGHRDEDLDLSVEGHVARFSRDERRDQLAESTLATLAELGYAGTSLREIAQHTDFSHGVLHYYFEDKDELIVHGLRRYRAQCLTRYGLIVATATDAVTLARAFADTLADTAAAPGATPRVWYDLRVQGMFVAALRDDVRAIDEALERMIWRVVARYAALRGTSPVFGRRATYALVDGLFERAVLDHAAGDEDAPARLAARVERLLPALVGDAVAGPGPDAPVS